MRSTASSVRALPVRNSSPLRTDRLPQLPMERLRLSPGRQCCGDKLRNGLVAAIGSRVRWQAPRLQE